MTTFAINPPNVAMVNPATGKPTAEGYKFFLAIQRTIGEGLVSQIQNANYLAYSSSTVLTNGKVLTAGTGISFASGAGTYTISIDASVVVTKTAAQTLTNKTLTSPVVSGGTVDAPVGTISPSPGVFTTLGAILSFEMPAYEVSALPSALAAACLIYVTDESGGPVPAFSDGVNWRRVTDRAIVS